MSKPSNSSINVRGLTFLVADQNAFFSSLCNSILRSFGAGKILEARNTADTVDMLVQNKVDLLLCDAKLPADGGLELTRWIRFNSEAEFRAMPILIMTGDPRMRAITAARDVGANMVVTKPLSPSLLFDRLAWIAHSSRKFVDSSKYYGPDRRFKIEGFPNGVGRRKGDQATDLGEATGPAMSQDDIDKLLKTARSG